MTKPMQVLAVLAVVGYLSFELYALKKTKYRTEPLYIFDQFLLAHHAANKCGSPEEGQLEQFRRNLASVTARAARALREPSPGASEEDIDRMLSARSSAREQEVDAIIGSSGCSGAEMKTLLKRFQIRARLRVG